MKARSGMWNATVAAASLCVKPLGRSFSFALHPLYWWRRLAGYGDKWPSE
jgi:hypothetical protein